MNLKTINHCLKYTLLLFYFCVEFATSEINLYKTLIAFEKKGPKRKSSLQSHLRWKIKNLQFLLLNLFFIALINLIKFNETFKGLKHLSGNPWTTGLSEKFRVWKKNSISRQQASRTYGNWNFYYIFCIKSVGARDGTQKYYYNFENFSLRNSRRCGRREKLKKRTTNSKFLNE